MRRSNSYLRECWLFTIEKKENKEKTNIFVFYFCLISSVNQQVSSPVIKKHASFDFFFLFFFSTKKSSVRSLEKNSQVVEIYFNPNLISYFLYIRLTIECNKT